MGLDALVVDNGSYMFKAGISGDDQPKAIFPAIVGRPKYSNVMSHGSLASSLKEYYLADEAYSRRALLQLETPIQRGLVNNWEYAEKLWHYTFYGALQTPPDNRSLLLTEVPLNPRVNREKITELMFEKFKVPSLYIATQSVLSLYASGRVSGIVCESGDGISACVPIIEGTSLIHATQKMNLGGRDVTDYFGRLWSERVGGYKMTTETVDNEMLRQAKEKMCYVALDYDHEMKTAEESSTLTENFVLPDGNTIEVNEEKFKAPEVIFSPSLIGAETVGIHELLQDAVQQAPIDNRKEMYRNIVLAGGSTGFKGFSARLTKELIALAPSTAKIKVHEIDEALVSAWVGGSILSSLSTFEDMLISVDDYEEFGPEVTTTRKHKY